MGAAVARRQLHAPSTPIRFPLIFSCAFHVELLRQYDPHDRYPTIWTTLTAELDRRHAGAALQRMMVHIHDLSGLPFAVKEMLRRG
jgi:hypothetical protein